MPSANIYLSLPVETFAPHLYSLRDFIAVQLSGASRRLTPEEVSIRIISVAGGLMIAPVEIEITAYAYPERIQKQDDICRAISHFITQQSQDLSEVHVWLLLCELGRSWEE